MSFQLSGLLWFPLEMKRKKVQTCQHEIVREVLVSIRRIQCGRSLGQCADTIMMIIWTNPCLYLGQDLHAMKFMVNS
jgi:hypothetical protein